MRFHKNPIPHHIKLTSRVDWLCLMNANTFFFFILITIKIMLLSLNSKEIQHKIHRYAIRHKIHTIKDKTNTKVTK